MYVGRFEQIFDHHTIFDGVTYTDAHVTLTGMLLVSAALLLGAVIAAVGGMFGAARTLAGGGCRSSRGLLCRSSAGGLVRLQFYCQAQRIGARAALHRK